MTILIISERLILVALLYSVVCAQGQQQGIVSGVSEDTVFLLKAATRGGKRVVDMGLKPTRWVMPAVSQTDSLKVHEPVRITFFNLLHNTLSVLVISFCMD